MSAARRSGAEGAARRSWVSWVAGGAVLALVVTLAVISQGYDSRELPREDPSVWVERAVGQYARVNTETAEIDTVRAAESSSGIVQTANLGLLLTQGFGRVWPINPSSPVDVQSRVDEQSHQDTGAEFENDADANRTPEGTRQVIAAGGFVVFATQDGDAYVSRVIGSGAGASLGVRQQLDPLASERSEQQRSPTGGYAADAVALDETGLIALFSRAEQAVRWFDARSGEPRGAASETPTISPSDELQLAIVQGKWALFEPVSGNLWVQDLDEPIALDILGSAQLQVSSSASADILVADEGGLWRVNQDGSAERIVQTTGSAAQPRFAGTQAVAAWLSAAGGLMWTADTGEVMLELDQTVDDLSNPELEIRTNDTRATIVERESGMIWTVPDGQLIAVEQWRLIDPPKQESGEVVTQDVTEQEPPVAMNDEFGVRAGEPTMLPVMLNDFDPNRRDVLTIVNEGLEGALDPNFGTLSVMSDGQGLIVQPSATARGSESFTYRITDGVNISSPATVTLSVESESVNSAPDWCLVEGCQRTWPSPELTPGGTMVMPIIEGWVDPEGDPIMLIGASVVNADGALRALVTADGKLAMRHTDPNADDTDAVIKVRVIDSRGAENERDLRVRIRSAAGLEFTAAASTVTVGEPTVLRPLERVIGGSGSFQLADATVQQGSLTATSNQGRGTVEVLASAPGNAMLSVTVRDSVTGRETVGVVRINAVESRSSLGIPPLRAFVRPLADSTVDVFAAIPNASSRALTVQSATVRDGQLRADVIEHSSVRVSGSTIDGQPGRIGSVDIVVAEATVSAQGRLTVFQVGEVGGGAIAVADTATVRAGSVVDIAVLENDVAPPGDRLVLHPEIAAPGAPGELAFASGPNVRYLAPDEPGTYTLSYTTYGASSPEQSDVGQVRVTVLPIESNRDPLPVTMTVRLAPGERVQTTIPLSGADPDGDRLRLVSVDAPEDAQLSTSILARSNSVQVEASSAAQRGSSVVGYTVRDSHGGEAKGRLRVIVTEPDSGGRAPVVYSDYVRLASGVTEPAVVRPLDNDIDPAGGVLELVSVEPNVPGGASSPLYRSLLERLDLSRIDEGIVLVSGGELGTVSYRYTVRSTASKSTAEGLIVVQVSERVGQQAPRVTDTVLSVRDRADFERVGVDVVTERVRWASGDVANLELSVWGEAAEHYRVVGSNIVGKYSAEGGHVPFRVAGIDLTGSEVESFGFLIIPPLDELRLTLRSGIGPITLNENTSVDIDVTELLDLGSADQIELEQSAFTVQRGQASCVPTGSTTLRYSAGREAPWNDTCTIRVRLVEQHTYTTLSVPISIVPDQPVAQLNPLTRTISPGSTETINLLDMLQWQGGREGSTAQLQWQVTGGGQAFEVTTNGAQVRAVARAGAVPGSQEVYSVSVAGQGESQAALTLRVGEAAVDTPAGGTVLLQCTVDESCSAPLIGAAGQHDPFEGKPGGGLQLVAIDDGGCQFGEMSIEGESLAVGWPTAGGPGGKCTATFTVKDAQNRIGTGKIEFDALGVPRAPTAVLAASAGASSISVSVALSSTESHPAVTGVELLSGGSPVGRCELEGGQATCTVTGLKPGDRSYYQARAINDIGSSQPSESRIETWAYVPPAPPTISAATLPWADNTNQLKGRIKIDIGPSAAASKLLMINDIETPISANGTYTVDAGTRSLKVYSVDDPSMIPPAYTGNDDGRGSANTASVTAIGAPHAGTATLQLSGENRTDWSVSHEGWNRNGAPDNADGKLNFNFAIGTYSGPNSSGSGLEEHQVYTATMRASNSYGRTSVVETNSVTTGAKLPTLTGTYAVEELPAHNSSWSISYLALDPSYTPAETGIVTFSGVSPGDPIGTVVQCAEGGVNCSDEGTVSPESYEPLDISITACVAWNGVDLPTHEEIDVELIMVGDPGTTYTLSAESTEADQSGNITIDWGGERGAASFVGGLCAPTL